MISTTLTLNTADRFNEFMRFVDAHDCVPVIDAAELPCRVTVTVSSTDTAFLVELQLKFGEGVA